MKVSALLMPTLKEVPAEAEVISHKLLLRSGMIRKVAGGVYNYLPLGWRVLQKVANIVREEMDKVGSQEILMPIIQPAELWEESGRWDVYGKELIRFKDRHDRDFCLGPTHEEVITDLIRREINSYKQLPLLMYQIQNKYRDERRPRFGLMRGREFMMKDLYSFDKDFEGLDISYKTMYEAYSNILKRCGLNFRAVEADAGAIGGNTTHEFMVLANSGEAEIVYCDKCNYAANVEKAVCSLKENLTEEEMKSLQLLSTPNIKTIDQISEFAKVAPEKTIKTLLYSADGEIVCTLVRGDRELNEIKLQHVLDCKELALASDEEIIKATDTVPGYIGPVGLNNIKIIADEEITMVSNAITGANKNEYHYINVNYDRDFNASLITDIRTVRKGDLCPKCKEELLSTRGIEVGHIFQLGTKYSDAMQANYLDENGKTKPVVMGCYGIGISRTMAAAIEQNYDENGIIWPISIAPYHVIVVPINAKNDEQLKIATEIYEELLKAGIEVILDDRKERAGVKFADADLIGYPIRITVGKKTINESTVDLKLRNNGLEETISINGVVSKIKEILS